MEEHRLFPDFVAAVDEFVTPVMTSLGWNRIGAFTRLQVRVSPTRQAVFDTRERAELRLGLPLPDNRWEYSVGYEANDLNALHRLYPGAHPADDEDWFAYFPDGGEIQLPARLRTHAAGGGVEGARPSTTADLRDLFQRVATAIAGQDN